MIATNLSQNVPVGHFVNFSEHKTCIRKLHASVNIFEWHAKSHGICKVFWKATHQYIYKVSCKKPCRAVTSLACYPGCVPWGQPCTFCHADPAVFGSERLKHRQKKKRIEILELGGEETVFFATSGGGKSHKNVNIDKTSWIWKTVLGSFLARAKVPNTLQCSTLCWF